MLRYNFEYLDNRSRAIDDKIGEINGRRKKLKESNAIMEVKKREKRSKRKKDPILQIKYFKGGFIRS